MRIPWEQRVKSWKEMLFGIEESPTSERDVSARNYVEATQYREGITPEGSVFKAAVRVGKNRWRLDEIEYNQPQDS